MDTDPILDQFWKNKFFGKLRFILDWWPGFQAISFLRKTNEFHISSSLPRRFKELDCFEAGAKAAHFSI